MDNAGGNTPASDQNRRELSISLAASSMINASDMITAEAYQANLKRIQEVKEMVQKLETNNVAAHENFLVDQLEKRAKDGREAEDVLTRLRNQPGLSETVQFTNNVPSDKAEVILPTTATLVEVPESYSSPAYSSPAPTSTYNPPQTVQQGRPTKYQWNPPPQIQPYNPDVFRHYIPPPQCSLALYTQVPVDQGQPGWYRQNQPPQSRVHNPPAQTGFQPIQVQQPSRSWSSHPPQVIALPAADSVSGYHTSPTAWIRTAPANGGPSTGPSNPTYHEPRFPTQSTVSRPPVTSHNHPLNFTSRAQVPLPGVPAVLMNPPFGQSPHIRSHPKPAGSQSRPVSTAVSKPVAISELQRPHKPPQPFQQQSQPQLVLQPQLELQQRQPQPQRLPQPPLQSQQHPQQSQVQLLSQRPPQPPHTHQQAPPPSADRASSTSAPQPHSQPSQPPRPTIVPEQVQQRGTQLHVDQATFIKHFQSAVQRGMMQLKTFWFHARASGVTDEWFKIAIDSLPRNVWQSVIAQANQSGPTRDAPPPANAPQQQVTIPGPNVPVVSTPPPLTATPLDPIAQQATKPNISTKESITHSAPRQTPELYAKQLQYYAEQAIKSALSTQVASISKSLPGNIAPTRTMLATPKWDAPQVQANVRTPKDANKSTLAGDILRALGRIVENRRQETGGEPADKMNHHEGKQLPEVTPSQPISRPASVKTPVVPLATSSVDANSLSRPSVKPNVQDEPQRAAPPCRSIAKAVLEEEHGQAAVIEGPIMIDLTSEDSSESIDGKGQEPTFPMQSSARAAVSPQPVSATNTTDHTPLFENLSLEEPPVDAAGASDNADLRMYTPPLSLAAEENMDSELLYPPPGNTEPVLPSFKPLPSEPNEHPLDGQLPLFLPSPPVSPAPTEPPATDSEMISDEGKSRPSLKRRSVEVDNMEIDTEMATPRVRKRRKQQVYVLIPPAPLYVKKAKVKERAMAGGIESELEGVGQDEELQYSHLEQLLIEESKLRLFERRCRWLNCGAILNCAANLLAHLKNHAREEALEAPFLCHWASCQRQFSMEQERDVHLERHTIRPLPCPFTGCNKQFDQPVEVMQHEVQHQKADHRELLVHKPTCQPIVPAIPARLGPPPRWLPSHRVIPRRVAKCQISADRHAIVGPWVLWNIFSPVDLNMRKQNASMRGRPTRQAINYDMDSSDPRRDDYDFLLALSSYPAEDPQLDDLDSTLITMSTARGLTLWGSGATVNSRAGSATPEEYTNALAAVVDATVPSSATDETKVEGKSNGNEVAAAARRNSITPEAGPSGPSMAMGEEDAVERMLIL